MSVICKSGDFENRLSVNSECIIDFDLCPYIKNSLIKLKKKSAFDDGFLIKKIEIQGLYVNT
ncbi:MAG: hypothetical protein PHC47_02575 [Clostridia bacterium]|nr:hypothetical protein [Clostridia bacterium]